MNDLFESRENPDIDAVLEWFKFLRELIGERRAEIRRMLASGADLPAAWSDRFAGLTGAGIDSFLDGQINQLEMIAMLELLATTEAVLRIDFRRRVKLRKKDSLSRRFRQIKKERNRKVSLDKDILEALREEGISVSQFRATLRLRNWLAHGRHWPPGLGRNYTPELVYDVARELIDSIPV